MIHSRMLRSVLFASKICNLDPDPMELASGRKVSGVALRAFFSRQGHAHVGQMVIQF